MIVKGEVGIHRICATWAVRLREAGLFFFWWDLYLCVDDGVNTTIYEYSKMISAVAERSEINLRDKLM